LAYVFVERLGPEPLRKWFVCHVDFLLAIVRKVTKNHRNNKSKTQSTLINKTISAYYSNIQKLRVCLDFSAAANL
jgi:hypothetical protein